MPKGPYRAQLYFVKGLHIVQPMVASEKEIITYKYIMYIHKIFRLCQINQGLGICQQKKTILLSTFQPVGQHF